MIKSVDDDTVEDFGQEWTRFNQSGVSARELKQAFDGYFAIFPWQDVGKESCGFDLGCGSGRWAQFVAPQIKELHCIDPSDAALAVARETLRDHSNCVFHLSDAEHIPLADASTDFGYSLGVLHHVPDTQMALHECARVLRPRAPFLIYLYYALENMPRWYRLVWKVSDHLRRIISALPYKVRIVVADSLAGLVYWPLARSARILEMMHVDVDAFPLSYYRRRNFYSMRTDALDRFATRVEKRFTQSQIIDLLHEAGFTDIKFGTARPYWCAIARRSL
jgi:ubiquinone/menaquinone biosynthesis C-methylase UbiE